MPIHVSAEEGYAAVGATYEKGRPEYPPDAVAFLLQRLGVAANPDATVVDLAAGTGKFSRALLAAETTPIAIEPVAHMRDTFRDRTPGVRIEDGTAESIPLEDNSVDAVVAAQAFHWFDGPAALREIHRVLKPGGALGLVWNRGPDVEWAREIWADIETRRDDTPSAWSYKWRDAFTATKQFGPLRTAIFRHDNPTDRDGLIARVTSISFVARGTQADRDALVEHVLAVCDEARLPQQFNLPYNCHVHWCRCV